MMGKGRLEAFSDGVLAIIITIMVLELKVPHGHEVADLEPMVPVFLAYILSFVFIGIYWNNHHHLLHLAHQVSASVMWANLHLLFWLSLVPASTAWLGENAHAVAPNALYGVVLFMAGIAYLILQRAIVHTDGESSELKDALGSDLKGKLSALLYLGGIGLSFVSAYLSQLLYVTVALIWLIPDRRIEKRVTPT